MVPVGEATLLAPPSDILSDLANKNVLAVGTWRNVDIVLASW